MAYFNIQMDSNWINSITMMTYMKLLYGDDDLYSTVLERGGLGCDCPFQPLFSESFVFSLFHNNLQ